MLAVAPQTIAQAILAVFATTPTVRIERLHRAINAQFMGCSQRAVYKEVAKLVEQGIVIGVGGNYSLSLTWILSLNQLSERFYSQAVEPAALSHCLPLTGKRVSWKFRDLQHLDRLWLQLMFLLFELSESRRMFVWVPYFWFDLVHFQKDLEAQEAMKVAGNKMYMILGNDSFIDRLPTKYWSRQVYEWSYAKGPFENERSTNYDLIDDYILTVKLDQRTTNAIDTFFRSVRSKSDLGRIREFETIKTSAQATLTLEHSPRKAKVLRRKFLDYFGIV